MTSTPREIGTLIVVILKARNLPNKRHIGKQDPYCSVGLNNDKRRTKAIKRGGQHPEWDEEVRFTLFEDVEDVLARTTNGDDEPPPPPPKDDLKSRSKSINVEGGKSMKVSCYADDPREPEFIGEATVDLTEVLTKGETDEWFTLLNKGKYSGEVYLELTFWSNERPPEKKVTPKPTKGNKQYGGPGSFISSDEYPSSSSNDSNGYGQPLRTASNGSIVDDFRQDSLPSSLRVSGSLANLDLYVPPYEQESQRRDRQYASSIDQITNDFGELDFEGTVRRRDSFPLTHGTFTQQSSTFSSDYPHPQPLSSHHTHAYSQNEFSESGSSLYDYTSASSAYVPNQTSHAPQSYSPVPSNYQVPYEPGKSSFSTYSSSSTHRSVPRFSLPSSSSGFFPIPTPAPSGFVPISSHVSEPTGFAPPSSHTPVPFGYGHPSSQFSHPSNLASSSFAPSFPSSSSSLAFHSQPSTPPPPSFPYPQYPPPPPASAPPPTHAMPSPPPNVPSPSYSAPPQQHLGYSPHTPSPPHQRAAAPPIAQYHTPPPPPPIQSGSSRPLPTPALSLSIQNTPGQGPPLSSPNGHYNPVPPPPLPNPSPPSYMTNGQPVTGPPSLLPRPQYKQYQDNTLTRRSSLPQPPVSYPSQIPSAFQPIPPPPPPPQLFRPTQQPIPPPPPPPQFSLPPSHSQPLPLPPRPPAQVPDQPSWTVGGSQVHPQDSY